MKDIATNSGFSLIELMVTVAVLVVLAGIAIPAYNGYVDSARNTEGLNNLHSLELAEQEYFLDNNEYFFGATTSLVESASSGLWSPAEAPADRNFSYAATQSGSSKTVVTLTVTKDADSSVLVTKTLKAK